MATIDYIQLGILTIHLTLLYIWTKTPIIEFSKGTLDPLSFSIHALVCVGGVAFSLMFWASLLNALDRQNKEGWNE